MDMDSVDEIIAAFGITQFGLAIGATPQAVWNMRARGSIPSRYWKALVAAAEQRGIEGISYDLLATLAERTRALETRGAR